MKNQNVIGNSCFPEHAKDALELAKMQESTAQLDHQKSIKVCDYVYVMHVTKLVWSEPYID